MARPREFDPELALEKAMGLFWDVGYEEASLSRLLKVMGLTKGSFYKAFKSKDKVYLATLDRYEKDVVSVTVAYLGDTSEGDGKSRILRLFRKVAEMAQSNGDRLGCYLCNALVDKAAQGGEAEGRLNEMVERLERAFERALLEPQDTGQQLDKSTARKTARGILSIYFGMRVLGRAGLSGNMADDLISQVEGLIDRAFNASAGPVREAD